MLLNLNKVLQHTAELAEEPIKMYPFLERDLLFKWALIDMLTLYRRLQKDSKKIHQMAALAFLKKPIVIAGTESQMSTHFVRKCDEYNHYEI